MRRLIALLCLCCFLAIQYGRIMSYWECRLRAAYTAATCDCEKLITENGTDKGHISTAFPVKGISEEVYDHSFCSMPDQTAPAPGKLSIPISSTPLPDADAKGIFQPPRI